MITFSKQHQSKPKAVGLLSGGLDSCLAAKIIVDLGFEVHAVYFAQPWGCCDKDKAKALADQLGIHFVPMQLDERYLDIIENPKYGYGAALNPCRDCRIHMFKRAGEYMRRIGAEFCFTGEVVGQREMSQLKNSMRLVEKHCDLEGYLLRPLSGKYLPPTIPEQKGIVDRDKLFDLSGRSRKAQMKMAEEFGITDYMAPAGGCLLTDKNFANRMKDSFQYGYRNFRETIALKWGRHYRLSPEIKIIVGRDKAENDALERYAHAEDYLFKLPTNDGPVVVLKATNPSPELLASAAGYLQRFSKYRYDPSVKVECWLKRDKNSLTLIDSRVVEEEEIEKVKV